MTKEWLKKYWYTQHSTRLASFIEDANADTPLHSATSIQWPA